MGGDTLWEEIQMGGDTNGRIYKWEEIQMGGNTNGRKYKWEEI